MINPSDDFIFSLIGGRGDVYWLVVIVFGKAWEVAGDGDGADRDKYRAQLKLRKFFNNARKTFEVRSESLSAKIPGGDDPLLFPF